MPECKYGDPICPCQDGDLCHYEGDRPMTPPKIPEDLKCCANCKHWHKKDYIHCQCSGPWGALPQLGTDKNCTFERKKNKTPNV